MNRKEAIAKYKDVLPVEILYSYKPHDASFIFNNDDPDLEAVRLSLPEPPEWHLIDGFGLPAKQQKFTKSVYPARLEQLERDVIKSLEKLREVKKAESLSRQRIIEEMWNQLSIRRRDFIDEILWIEKQWYFILNGYWCFINGKPTYIDGWHYAFVNEWDLSDAKTEYRDRDRRFFHILRWLYTTKQGIDGSDTNHRTFYGAIYPKHRRDGATHKALCVLYFITILTTGAMTAGIQSFDNDNAREHYVKKVLPAFKGMKFYLKPIWKGSQAPQSELSFTRSDNSIGTELGSGITYATTSHRKFYDGKKLIAIDLEEEGKTLEEDVYERWGVIKHCLAQGNGSSIHGFAMHPTTVADITTGGGANFIKLCKQSKLSGRNPKTGQTKTGLIVIFMPACDGLENFIGPYGESIIDNPTPEQAEYIGRDIGAREYIQSQLDELLRDGSPDAMTAYRELRRLFPMCFADVFRSAEGDAGFDIESIEKRMEILRRENAFGNPHTVQGDFAYEIDGYAEPVYAREYIESELWNKYPSPKVIWVPSKSGRWNVSKLVSNDISNKKFVSDGEYYPQNPLVFTTGGDPFQFLKTAESKKREDNSRLSRGGLVVFEERNYLVDPPSKDISEWETYRNVATYENRPESDDEYAEEALMACIYYGSEMYCETNVKLLWKHFVKRKHSGYMKYGFKDDGTRNSTPGFYSLTDSKQALFSAIKTHIKWHVARENHIEVLEQVRSIKGLEYMTDFDLFTAYGAALLGSRNVDIENGFNDQNNHEEYSEEIIPEFEYS